jgi:hypothetical protein
MHQAASASPATEQDSAIECGLHRAATAADSQLAGSMERRRQPEPAETSVAELNMLATHAEQRLALYRQKMYRGRGDATRLAELERIFADAQSRAQRAKRSARAGGDLPREPTSQGAAR